MVTTNAPAIDINPAHARQSIRNLQSAIVIGTNISLTASNLDPLANAFNFYSTTDDVNYVLLASSVPLSSGSATIYVANAIGTNCYAATAIDTNLLDDIQESDRSVEVQFPPPAPMPAMTNLIVTFQTPCTNPIVMETADLLTFTPTTNFTVQNSGTNLVISIPDNRWRFYQFLDQSLTVVPHIIQGQ